MRAPFDPLGEVLMRMGALPGELLGDVLEQQQHAMPLASLCYVLGYLDEDVLARALSRQLGVPSVVLDRCVIRLDVLDGVPRDTALRYNVLPIHEDHSRIYLAARDPGVVPDFLREVGILRGKTPVVHVALYVTLARTLRACYLARDRGDVLYAGPLASMDAANTGNAMSTVSDVLLDTSEDAIAVDDILATTSESLPPVLLDADGEPYLRDGDQTADPGGRAETYTEVFELEFGDSGFERPEAVDGPGHVLVVDGDFATRHLLIKTLQPLGLFTTTAATGSEAIRQIKTRPPDLAIIDVDLPEIDGFQICRGIKQSSAYRHIAVILMSADPGRVTEDLLGLYGAAAALAKPIDAELARRQVESVLAEPDPMAGLTEEDGVARAIERYKTGDVDGAIAVLRTGLAADPSSARHHFVLANLLQKKAAIYEAIDEYEATIELEPDYFPALTRLAYLYYKQGYSAKAIEMWRRSLPHCKDSSLRQNIEMFMRKLIAEMQSQL